MIYLKCNVNYNGYVDIIIIIFFFYKDDLNGQVKVTINIYILHKYTFIIIVI